MSKINILDRAYEMAPKLVKSKQAAIFIPGEVSAVALACDEAFQTVLAMIDELREKVEASEKVETARKLSERTAGERFDPE